MSVESASETAARPPWRALWLVSIAAIVSSCATPRPVPTDAEVEAYLRRMAPRYDASEAMLAGERTGPDYHTTIARGTRIHATVDSLDYALALLAAGRRDHSVRADAILRRVAGLQVDDASSEHFGLWPWFLEEPVAEMAPCDPNWADFCGARVAQALVHHADALTDRTRSLLVAALGRAARAIRSRDVNPGYTNVAVMGAGVAIAAGELRGEPGLVVYGRDKLRAVVELTDATGELREYNSPIYNLVVLFECERVLHLCRDDAARRSAEHLRHVAWRTIARSFHRGTNQWAGPHSRAYGDRLGRGQLLALGRRLDRTLPLHDAESQSAPFPVSTVPARPCPPEFRAAFTPTTPDSAREIRRVFRVADEGSPARIGTTWFTASACLGSINAASLWEQRRPLLAYWRTDNDPAVIFRVRGLRDGQDCPALGILCTQRGHRVSCTFRTRPDRGARHLNLDVPKDGHYEARDLRLRFELRGVGATTTTLAPHRFALAAGTHRIVLDVTGGEFLGHEVRCEVVSETGRAHVDLILFRGPPTRFDFRGTPAFTTRVELALEGPR